MTITAIVLLIVGAIVFWLLRSIQQEENDDKDAMK